MVNTEPTRQSVRPAQVVDPQLEQVKNLSVREEKRAIKTANQNSAVARIVNIVYFIFTAIVLLLGVRFTLQLIGANDGNAFSQFIDQLSYPFVALFSGLVQNPVVSGTSVFEFTTLIAMGVWAIVAWGIGSLIWLMFSRPR